MLRLAKEVDVDHRSYFQKRNNIIALMFEISDVLITGTVIII
jgi:hypothetical protein